MYRARTTLEQWRIFQAVVEYGGYAQAAEQLNKSQSSLNHAVAKLQQQLGIELLTIKGRKAVLTEAGTVMLRRARGLTQSVQDIEELALNIDQGWEPEIRLGVEVLYPKELLIKVLQEFYPRSHGSRLQLIDTVVTGSFEIIQNKQADLAITNTIPKGRLGHALGSVNIILVCHPQHELARAPKPMDHNLLLQHLHLVIRDTAAEPKEKAGWLRAEQRWTVNNFHEALLILKQGLGYCWVPEHLARPAIAAGELVHLDIDGGNERRVNLNLVLADPESAGPGTRLLAELLLAHPLKKI